MTCSGCARNVTEAIQSVAGVDSAMVSVEQRKATVRWIAGEPVKVEAVVRAVREAGYEAEAVEARPGAHHHAAGAGEGIWESSVLFGVIPTALLKIGRASCRERV